MIAINHVLFFFSTKRRSRMRSATKLLRLLRRMFQRTNNSGQLRIHGVVLHSKVAQRIEDLRAVHAVAGQRAGCVEDGAERLDSLGELLLDGVQLAGDRGGAALVHDTVVVASDDVDIFLADVSMLLVELAELKSRVDEWSRGATAKTEAQY